MRKSGMQATRVIVAVMAALSASGAATAAEAPAGALSCSGCHAGSARVETPVPRLAGRTAGEITDAMLAYKSGKQAGTIMDRIAKGFSDEEIRAIAAWYATQK
jgi:sulfide dehydrogenase cytochrome subunit